MERKSKNSRIGDYIENQILTGVFAVGEQIPSVRRLAAKFKVDYTTVYREFERLIGLGLLERSPQVGFFVRRRIRKMATDPLLEFVIFHRKTTYKWVIISAILNGMLESMRNAGARCRFVELAAGDFTPGNLLRHSGSADGIILLQTTDRKTLPDSWFSCPCVGLLASDCFGGRISSINIDYTHMAELAANYFLKYNRRFVKVFSAAIETYLNRAYSFISFFERCGGIAELSIGKPEDDWAISDRTGYFFSSDSQMIVGNEDCLKKHGENLFDRCRILGVDGRLAIDPDMIPAPTIAYDYYEMGKVAFEELMRQVQTPGTIRRNVSFFGEISYDLS